MTGLIRGNTLINLVNGRVTSIMIDDELEVGGEPRLDEGLIGLQLHSGPPMRVEFREIYLRPLRRSGPGVSHPPGERIANRP